MAWSAEKQKIVTLSSTELEYGALTSAAQELMWLKLVLDELNCPPAYIPSLNGDNTSSHFLAQNSSHHKRTKHIDVRYHWIREQLKKHEFTLDYINTSHNPADFLTKFMMAVTFHKCSSRVMYQTPTIGQAELTEDGTRCNGGRGDATMRVGMNEERMVLRVREDVEARLEENSQSRNTGGRNRAAGRRLRRMSCRIRTTCRTADSVSERPWPAGLAKSKDPMYIYSVPPSSR